MNTFLSIASSTVLGAAAAIALSSESMAQTAAPYADFRGAAIVTISDGDMKASAYIGGQLGADRQEDKLTVTRLTPDLTGLTSVSIDVSNSVAGPPTAVAVSPDGNWAFVTESFGQPPADGQTFRDLPIGDRLTAIDLSDLSAPAVTQDITVGKRPEGISVHPAGDLIALTLHPADGRQLAFVPFADGRLGEPQYVSLSGIEPSERISHVEWHPSGRFIAVTLVNSAIIRFAQVERGEAGVTVSMWGNPVLTSKYPFMGRFTPDGRHFLTGNLYWGSDVPGIWAEAVDGDVTSIRFAEEASPGRNGDPQVRHYLVGKAGTGKDPEGIAISPDGRYVVSVNLETSYAPSTDPRHTFYSSVSLLALDPDTGRLTHLDTVRYDGILPEAATFDSTGRFVAVVTYDSHDPAVTGAMSGALDFFRVTADEKLVMLKRSHALPRGPHSMQLIQ